MNEEELREEIVKLKKELETTNDNNNALTSKLENLESTIKEKDDRIVKLQESNMRFFEQITVNNIQSNQQLDNTHTNDNNVSLDDIIDKIDI